MKLDYRERIRLNNIEKVLSMGESAYVYGAGYWANRLFNYFGEGLIERIDGIIVSNIHENPKSFRNIPVLDRKELTASKLKDIIIIVAIRDNQTLVDQLRSDGCEHVFPIQKIIPMFDISTESRLVALNHEYKRYINEFQIDNKIFSLIHIETVNRCNGTCSFCPVNCNMPQREYSKMSRELFVKIINQLKDIRYSGIIGLFCNNEPLLDERLEFFAEYAHSSLPDAFIYIKTNGILMNLLRFKKLIPYFNKIGFDNYKSVDMPQNIKEIHQYCEQNNLMKKFYYFAIEENAERQSRGGTSPNSRVFYTLDLLCPLLFNQMIVRPDGKISLCCCDALGHYTLGDLNEDSILDIWKNATFNHLRKQMAEFGRYPINACRYCNHIDERDLWSRGEDFMSPAINWEKLCINKPVEGKDIYIFGANKYAVDFASYLKKQGCNVIKMVDNELALQDSHYVDNARFSVAEEIFENTNVENIMCYVVTPGRYDVIQRELIEFGIKDIRLVFI